MEGENKHPPRSTRTEMSQVARRVRGELDQQYPPGRLYPIEDLEDICEFTYGYLADLCADEIVTHLEQFAETRDMPFRRAESVHGPVSFLFGGSVLTCRIGPSVQEPRVVIVNLSRASAVDVARPREQEIRLDVSGRYRAARLYVDDLLNDAVDSIAELLHTSITAGDRWIEAFVVSQLATLQDDPLAQLYALVRRPFAAELGRAIRVYLVDPTRGGGVFMDEEARQDTLTQLAGYAYVSYEKAPVELLSGLLIARFSIEDTVAKEIIPTMTTVVKSPMEIPSGTQVGLAQHIMYHSAGMILQPLVALDKLWIEAAYPANLRDQVEPILNDERETIRDAVVKMKFGNVAEGSELSRRRRTERARHEGMAEQLTGLAGRFAGGFVSEYIQ